MNRVTKDPRSAWQYPSHSGLIPARLARVKPACPGVRVRLSYQTFYLPRAGVPRLSSSANPARVQRDRCLFSMCPEAAQAAFSQVR